MAAFLTLPSLAVWAAEQAGVPTKSEQANVPTVYMVSTSHLDTQWLWTIQETIGRGLPETFNGQFKLFEQFPDYQFNYEGSFRYKMIEEYYPAAFERMKSYIAAGRCFESRQSKRVAIPFLSVPSSLIYDEIHLHPSVSLPSSFSAPCAHAARVCYAKQSSLVYDRSVFFDSVLDLFGGPSRG